jgi:hypothetical protein
MTADKTERDWVAEIGKPTFENLAEMVAALECDYERLEELRDARDDFEPAGTCQNCDKETTWKDTLTRGDKECEHCTAIVSWAARNPDDAEELKELEAAANPCGNECKSRDYAEQMIHEDALSIEVRSGWTTPGEEMTPAEFCILLGTGGPAMRIVGDLDHHGEPSSARLEVQDWGKPWTEYYAGPGSSEVLLTYARCFCFAS